MSSLRREREREKWGRRGPEKEEKKRERKNPRQKHRFFLLLLPSIFRSSLFYAVGKVRIALNQSRKRSRAERGVFTV